MGSELNISFFPASDERTASSRIRVYSSARVLRSLGVSFSIGASPLANVYYVQKKVTPGILKLLRVAKLKGHKVIYDVDDFGSALEYWVSRDLLKKTLRLADSIFTPSPEGVELLQSMGAQNARVLPSCVDYYPDNPVRTSNKSSKLRVLWFGSSGNFPVFEKYIKLLVNLQDVQVVICMDDPGFALAERYPGLEFVPWDLSTFRSLLQSCHVSCLTHDSTPIGRSKSNNKMITSIIWGVPAVVTRTPDYTRTAHEAGIEDALFTDERTLISAITRLRAEDARERYLDVAQPPIWEKYSPSAITSEMLSLIRGVVPAHSFYAVARTLASYLP